MTCIPPFTLEGFLAWYKQLGRLKLFWAKPLVEIFPLYRVVDGCVLKARWSSEKPRLEEAYIAILKQVKKLDFLTPLRGVKILMTPNSVDAGLYNHRGALYIYTTSRPCAMGVYADRVEGHPQPIPDHAVLTSGRDVKYVVYLNRWNFNIDYLWSTPEYLGEAIESAICETQRHGGEFVTVATDDNHLSQLDLSRYRPDYLYNVYKLTL